MVKKMIAVWGSSGAGKSIITLALAAKFAKEKQNVVIINTDTTVPAIPFYIPIFKDNPTKNSIGSLVTANKVDYNSLKDKIILHPKNDRIGFMGLCSGETPITYKSFDRDNIMKLFAVLSGAEFDYIIYDCVSNPVYDQTTLLALETADKVIRVITPDIKGMEFSKAQCAWLKNGSGFKINEHIKVCSPVKETSPIDEVSSVIGGFDYILPYSIEAENNIISGDLLSGFALKQGILFENQIAGIAERIINE